MAPPFISYAQNGEDIVIWRVLNDIGGPGFYVDVGAADPVGYSATYALYLMGWNGINIEPVPQFADALRSVRPRDITVQIAAGSAAGSIEFHVARGTGLSTGSSEDAARLNYLGFETKPLTTEVRTLDSILETYCPEGQDIHVLKVDVEGMEKAVLQGVTLSRWRPWLCVVEATKPLSQAVSHEEWEHLLLDVGYDFHLFDGLNRYYLAREHEDLADRLTHGPSIFDQPYQRADVSLAIERHRDAVELRLTESQASIDRLDHELAVIQRQRDESVAQADALSYEAARLRDEHAAVAAQCEESEAILERLMLDSENARLLHEAELESFKDRLASVYASETWRLGVLASKVGHRSGLVKVAGQPLRRLLDRRVPDDGGRTE